MRKETERRRKERRRYIFLQDLCVSVGFVYLLRVPLNCEGHGASLPWGPLSPGLPGPGGWTQLGWKAWTPLILYSPSLLTDDQDSLPTLPSPSSPENRNTEHLQLERKLI